MSDEILATVPINGDVAEIDEKVRLLEEELATMEKRREEIEKEKIEYAKERIAALARTAPVNKMLPELLMKVFELAVIEPGKEGVELPLRLVTVSHLWRNIALATPKVWGRIIIEVEDDTTARNMMRRTQAFLERSKITQIDILIDFLQWSRSDDRNGLLKDTLEMLAPHMHRCTQLVARAREEEDAPAIFSTLTPHFGELLTDFTIESRDSVRLDIPEMPYLTRLAVDDVGPRNGWTPKLLSNLRSLSMRYFKPIAFEQFFTALESAKEQLEELRIARCTLAFDNNAFMFPSNVDKPYFPKLRKLTLVDILPGDIDVFFESFHAPALEDIHLGLDSHRFRYFKFMDGQTATSVERCPIKRIELEDNTIEGSELRALLALFQKVAGTLEEFVITAGDIDMRVFQALTADTTMLPNLRRIGCRKHNEITGRELFSLVQSRLNRDGAQPLEGVMVEKCRSFELEMLGQLRTLVRKVDYTPY